MLRINALAFAGERPCVVNNRDVHEFLPDVQADLANFDPPYATEFSQTNYERAYHFIEGLKRDLAAAGQGHTRS